MQSAQCCKESHGFALAGAVVDLVVHAQRLRPARHGEHGRDANATGDENDFLTCLGKPEMLAGPADFQRAPVFYLTVNPRRAAVAVGLAHDYANPDASAA